MFIIAVTLASAAAVWVQRAYRNWRLYISTILFMILCNLLYYYCVRSNLLWEYKPVLLMHHRIAELIITFIVFPCTVLLFLDGLERKQRPSWLQILKWCLIYWGVELAARLLHVIEYHKGWNYGWSIFFVLTMFPILLLHYRKALLAYAVAVVMTVFYMFVFKIPFL